jgi:protein arginine kinase
VSDETFPPPGSCNVGEWLKGTGQDADIAVCTRIRFARNVKGFRFSTCMTEEEAVELTQYLRRQLARAELTEQLDILDVGGLDELERRLLLERHLISRELLSAERPRFVAINSEESVSVMVNEEDHIRAQVFASGHSIDAAYRRAEELDAELMRRIPIAFSEEFGFLTACPTNTGTGLRVSVMLHLPGLVWAEEIEKATRAAQKTNMAVRGLYGEGSRATGDFYQVSNQITLGRSEAEITADVRDAVGSLVAWERKVRDALLKGEPRERTLDRIFRSVGTLERARILSTEEALTCLSAVRFGVQQGVVDELSLEQINAALLLAQPAHLQRLCNETLPTDERDQRRASMMRRLLGSA